MNVLVRGSAPCRVSCGGPNEQAPVIPAGARLVDGEFAKARQLIMQGKKINYEGASGPCDLSETGEVLATPYQVWVVDENGLAKLSSVYTSAD